MIRFVRSTHLAGLVARLQAPPKKVPVYQISYSTWYARLAGN